MLNKSNTKYLLVKGKYGFGNRLQALCEAIVYAELTKRKIIVDWKDVRYSDQEKNSFHLLFNGTLFNPTLKIPDTDSVFPSKWKGYLEMDLDFLWKYLESEPEKLKELFSADLMHLDYKEKIIVTFNHKFQGSLFNKYLHLFPKEWPQNTGDELLRYLLRNYITPTKDIQNSIKEFKKKNFKKPMIGVHIRYTDNVNKEGSAIPVSPEFFLQATERLMSDVPGANLFLATDNYEVESEFVKKFTNVVLLKKDFPLSSKKALHDPNPGTNRLLNAKQAIQDMYLLSECDYLIFSSMSSYAICASMLSNISDDKKIDLAITSYYQN